MNPLRSVGEAAKNLKGGLQFAPGFAQSAFREGQFSEIGENDGPLRTSAGTCVKIKAVGKKSTRGFQVTTHERHVPKIVEPTGCTGDIAESADSCVAALKPGSCSGPIELLDGHHGLTAYRFEPAE